jgi:hypothetical protein
MALVFRDRVRETSTTTGTGTFLLNGAVAGFLPFAAIGNANTTFYAIVDVTTGMWETGEGTFSVSGPSFYLSRDKILDSYNGSTTPLNFPAGTKEVYVTMPASKTVVGTQGMVFVSNTISADTDIPEGFNAHSPGPITIESGVTVTIPDGSVWTIS